jgi:BTB/POZ domain
MPEDIPPINCKRSEKYYLVDGNVVFLVRLLCLVAQFPNLILAKVDNCLFKVHRYFFIRDSDVFRDMFSVPPASTEEGTSDRHPIVLEQVKATDFEHLLWVYYNK